MAFSTFIISRFAGLRARYQRTQRQERWGRTRSRQTDLETFAAPYPAADTVAIGVPVSHYPAVPAAHPSYSYPAQADCTSKPYDAGYSSSKPYGVVYSTKKQHPDDNGKSGTTDSSLGGTWPSTAAEYGSKPYAAADQPGKMVYQPGIAPLPDMQQPRRKCWLGCASGSRLNTRAEVKAVRAELKAVRPELRHEARRLRREARRTGSSYCKSSCC